MTKQRRFTKEFENEAVQLVAMSGRTQRDIAEDLGVELSTLVRWIGRSRDRLEETPDQAPQADMVGRVEAPSAEERDPPAGTRHTEAVDRLFAWEGNG